MKAVIVVDLEHIEEAARRKVRTYYDLLGDVLSDTGVDIAAGGFDNDGLEGDVEISGYGVVGTWKLEES